MSDDNEDIVSPLTTLDQNAAHLHETYMSYMEAGFPEHRAFELVTLTLYQFLSS